jgi:5-methylthioadenosine/S-adenosylhomocysteine deaminase
MSEETADVLIVNGDIVTMDRERRVLLGGAIAVAGERILEVGATTALKEKYRAAPTVDARGGVVTPGLINGHQHLTNGVLIRSCVPDEWPSTKAINEWSIPMTAHVTGDDEELSATIIAAQSAINGVTMLIEAGSVTYPKRLAAGVRKVGIRSTTGVWGSSVKGRPYCGPTDEALEHQKAVLDAFPPGEGLVWGWVTLVGHSTASDDLMAGAADLARAYGTGMTMHMSPIKADPESYLARFNRRPIEHLHDLGVLGRHLLLGHGVWLDDSEVDLVLETGTAICYCPWAYFRLGQGTSIMGRHAEMHLRGGRICLGCDAVNAGDQVDILRQAALAAGLAKDSKVDPSWFGAHEAFEMATIRGAEAIGMDHLIGSLEAGKMADIVIHDPDDPNWVTKGDSIVHLVWSTDGRSVRDVFVAGKPVVRGGQCVNIDLLSLKAPALERRNAIFAEMGIDLPHRWPHLPAN